MADIVLYRDRLAGNWLATYRGATRRDDITATLPYSSAEQAGTVVALVKRANPGDRIGVKAQEFGNATIIACVAVVGEPILWIK